MNQADIARLLPRLYRSTLEENPPMAAIVDLMAYLHAPVEEMLARIEEYISPYRAPDRFVPYLAAWVDLDRFFGEDKLFVGQKRNMEPLSTGQGRLRELVACAAYLSQWRGTAFGLRLFLETATGVSGFDINDNVNGEDGQVQPFYFEVTAPLPVRVHDALVVRIIEQEKPAYVSYKLSYV